MSEQNLINAVFAHARQNYERDGWDMVLECYNDGDILELISDADAQDVPAAIAAVGKIAKAYNDHRNEIRNA